MSDPRSLLHNRLGQLLAQNKQHLGAIKHYEKAIELNPEYAAAHFNLASALCFGKNDQKAKAMDHYRIALKYQAVFPEAHVNLAAQLYATGEYSMALEHILSAIKQDPNNAHAYYNLNGIYRALGQQELAIQMSWQRIQTLVGHEIERVEKNDMVIDRRDGISVVCIKWGTKYGPEYVNKLYCGVRRHFQKTFEFYCLTEDSNGLVPKIHVLPLKEEFVGWWNKAQLFAPDFPLLGRIIYIDLDTVLVGDLSDLFTYNGSFGTLSTDDMYNERRRDGINSSVMIWSGITHSFIYTLLHKYFSSISQCIYKFDHFLEMTLPSHDILQSLYPNQILEYMQHCQVSCPPTARLITFPLEPKPATATAPWLPSAW
ncbi:hypothetical protein THRCLA_08360 [Thraustotheca clavata]|uniref:Uncharacterized protein n=1 Tax=Thraustotheca clavata TaxID=74557 RepID=A0A1V9Z7B2_9STRA|nr:hypothetical protein THRCLA_08360 [Thraustotheca clavata]